MSIVIGQASRITDEQVPWMDRSLIILLFVDLDDCVRAPAVCLFFSLDSKYVVLECELSAIADSEQIWIW